MKPCELCNPEPFRDVAKEDECYRCGEKGHNQYTCKEDYCQCYFYEPCVCETEDD